MRSLLSLRRLERVGDVFATIRGHDSGCTSYGIDDGNRRWFVKVAYGDDVEQLRSAERFHGRAVVYPWTPGEILNDPLAPGGIPHAARDSALNRFRVRPVAEIRRVLDTAIDAHVTVAARGFVAVDFYDGCLMYDATTERVALVDLDMYSPGPYILQADRQYGSRRFMAPEEFVRGSIIDERTTVFTLGRAARVLLGEPGRWRASGALESVTARATAADPSARFASVAEFAAAWRNCLA
ncbi:MAG: hypothetical protein ACRDOO_03360 [Actinomadura sp.]